MSAQPVHEEPDPRDPQVILERLPEREQERFLAQYTDAAHAAADDVAGYKRLQALLHRWSIRAQVVSQPGYYTEREERREAIQDGTRQSVPFFEAIDAEMARRAR